MNMYVEVEVQHHMFLNLPLGEGECAASHSGCITRLLNGQESE